MIKAVIFNLDGVLVNTDECHYQSWKRLAYEQGINLTPEVYKKIAGRKRLESLKMLLKKAERSYSPGELWALSARKNDLFNDRIDRLNQDSILPGAMETVKKLRRAGIKTAVASSSENAEGILKQLKIYSFFDAVVDGQEIDQGKPDPEALLTAARKLQMPTCDCLVVENTLAGMEAAQQAGMKAVKVGGTVLELEDDAEPPSLQIVNLPEYIQKLDQEMIHS